jgi:hypothetical protein
MDPNPTTPSKPAGQAGNKSLDLDQERRELHDIGAQASDALGTARQATSDAAGAATQSVKEVAAQVKTQAVDVTQKAVSQLKEHGNRAVTEQKERTATTLTDVGDALQKAADRLREEHDDNIASYIDAIAGMSNKAGSYLRGADVSSLVGDLQGMARRNPGLFFGGMFVAGLAVARFAKASRPQSPRGGNYGTSNYGTPGGYRQPTDYTGPARYPVGGPSVAGGETSQRDLLGTGSAGGGIGTPSGTGGAVTGSTGSTGGSTYGSSSLASNPAKPATGGLTSGSGLSSPGSSTGPMGVRND